MESIPDGYELIQVNGFWRVYGKEGRLWFVDGKLAPWSTRDQHKTGKVGEWASFTSRDGAIKALRDALAN